MIIIRKSLYFNYCHSFIFLVSSTMEFNNSSTLVHQSLQPPKFDRRLKFFLINVSVGIVLAIKKSNLDNIQPYPINRVKMAKI